MRTLDDPLSGWSTTANWRQFADADAARKLPHLPGLPRLCWCARKTLEKAYLAIVRGEAGNVPPLFVEQMVHAIMASILHGQTDPLRWRAAELFFRRKAFRPMKAS